MKEVVPDVWVGKPPSSDMLGSVQAVISCALDPCPTSLAELNVPVDDAAEAPIFYTLRKPTSFSVHMCSARSLCWCTVNLVVHAV